MIGEELFETLDAPVRRVASADCPIPFSPILAYAGLGILVGGVITAAVGRLRLKKLREQRRTSSVAFMPTTLGRGAQVQWEVRF